MHCTEAGGPAARRGPAEPPGPSVNPGDTPPLDNLRMIWVAGGPVPRTGVHPAEISPPGGSRGGLDGDCGRHRVRAVSRAADGVLPNPGPADGLLRHLGVRRL